MKGLKEGLPEKEGNLKGGTMPGFQKKEGQLQKGPSPGFQKSAGGGKKGSVPAKEKPLPVAESQAKKEAAQATAFDSWSVLLHPHLAEKSMTMVESKNTLTFLVDRRATKQEIKRAIEQEFQVSVQRVNVEQTRKGKKAYVTLAPGHSAADIATRLGML